MLDDLVNALRSTFSLDPQPDQSLGHDAAEMGAGFIPVVGQAMALRDMERARRAKDPVAGGLAAASLLPWGRMAGKAQQIIAGKSAKYAPKANLEATERFAAESPVMDPRRLADKTTARYGTYMGYDQKPRWEISDKDAKLKAVADQLRSTAEGKASDLFHHPELFRNYPELGDVKLSARLDPTMKTTGTGSYTPAWRGSPASITAAAADEAELRKSILHELQHGVQAIEPGFSRGTNPGTIHKRISREWAETFPNLSPAEIADIEKTAKRRYFNNMGEVEARAVEKRADWDSPTLNLMNPLHHYPGDVKKLWNELYETP